MALIHPFHLPSTARYYDIDIHGWWFTQTKRKPQISKVLKLKTFLLEQTQLIQN